MRTSLNPGRPPARPRHCHRACGSRLRGMCVQCAAGAASAATAATGMRAFLATRAWAWLTPLVLRRITAGLVGAGVVASAVLLG